MIKVIFYDWEKMPEVREDLFWQEADHLPVPNVGHHVAFTNEGGMFYGGEAKQVSLVYDTSGDVTANVGVQIKFQWLEDKRQPEVPISRAPADIKLEQIRGVIRSWRDDQYPYMTAEVRQLLEEIESITGSE